MKSAIGSFVVFVTVIFLSSVSAQSVKWHSMRGPYSGEIRCSIVVGDTIVIGTAKGIYWSSNDGNSWTRSDSPLDVKRLATVSGKVLAATTTGIYVSADRGESWAFLHGLRVNTLVYHNGALLAGGGSEIFRSSDQGANWKLVKDLNTSIIEILPINLTTLIVGGSNAIYRSSNGGSSWVMVDSQEHSGRILAGAVKDGSVFFGTDRSTIIRSTDYGNNWSDQTSPDFLGLVYGVTSIDGVVYASSHGDMHRSTDNGTTWTKLAAPFPRDFTMTIFRKGSNMFVGMYSGGMYRSSDNGEHWTSVGVADGRVDLIASIGSYVLVNGLSTLPHCTINGGKTWAPPSQPFDGLSYVLRKDSALYATTSFGGNYRSLDSGQTWQQFDSTFIGYETQTIHVVGDILLAGTRYFGVMRSTDDGKTFATSNEGIPEQTSVTAFAHVGGTIFASTTKGFYSSTDLGLSWTLVGSSSPAALKTLIATDSLLLGITSSGFFLKSSDQGQTWYDSASVAHYTSIALSDTILYASTSDVGVLRSTDYGQLWIGMNDGLPDTTVYAVHCDGDALYAGTKKGVFTTKPTGNVVWELVSGPQVLLMPNPARTSVKIHCSDRIDRFSIHDLAGRELSRNVDYAVNTEYPDIILDVTSLYSGIYIVRFVVGGAEVVRKFTVIK